MANIAITNTFSNGSIADAVAVNTNFSDIISGLSDASKDISVSAITAAGNISFTGSSITLGNATGDDLTITASLASTINIKTTASYNIGSSTLGLAGIYFGANSQTVRVVGSGSMSATWTLTLPVTAGTANYPLITNGSGVTSWTAWSLSAWAATTSALGTVYLPGTQVRSDTGNGYGSTSTKIRRFTTDTTVGSGITVTNNATVGNEYLIVQAGVYGVTYTDQVEGDGYIGISLNANASVTTNPQSLTATECLGLFRATTNGYPGCVTCTIRLAANDIIRAHTTNTTAYTQSYIQLNIAQLFRTA